MYKNKKVLGSIYIQPKAQVDVLLLPSPYVLIIISPTVTINHKCIFWFAKIYQLMGCLSFTNFVKLPNDFWLFFYTRCWNNVFMLSPTIHPVVRLYIASTITIISQFDGTWWCVWVAIRQNCVISSNFVPPVSSEKQGPRPDLRGARPVLGAHICHQYHKFYLWRKICRVEKF